MASFAIGIDLGTSTSEIAVYQHNDVTVIPDPQTKSPVIPSLVALNGHGDICVGKDAVSNADNPGKGIREVKRLMSDPSKTINLGDKEYRPEEISAIILKKLKNIAESTLSEEIQQAVVSIPANFSNVARQATINAIQMSGIELIQLINEPTAAALAFGINNIDIKSQIVVFDFGGGTLDITILEMNDGILDAIASYGDAFLGGKDFDQVMIDMIISKFNEKYPGVIFTNSFDRRIKEVAETAKINLSSMNECDVLLSAAGNYNKEDVPIDFIISRDEYETACIDLLKRTKECILKTMKAGKLKPSEIDKILMVGGTTYMPCVRTLVEEVFGKEPSYDVNPDLAVSMGAAIMAADKLGMIDPKDSIVLTDVCPFGLGISVVNYDGNRFILAYDELMKANTPAPYRVTKTYSLLTPDQREVEIEVYQDHTGNARYIEDAIFSEVSGTIDDIPPALYGDPQPVVVDFLYDQNQTARICAKIPGVNKSVTITYKLSNNVMSSEAIDKGKINIDSLFSSQSAAIPLSDTKWQEHPKIKKYMPLFNSADKLIVEYPDKEILINGAVHHLKEQLALNIPEEIKLAADRLSDILFDVQNNC